MNSTTDPTTGPTTDPTTDPTAKRAPRTLKEAFGRYTNTRIHNSDPSRLGAGDTVSLVVLLVAQIAMAAVFIYNLIALW